MKPFDW